MNIILAICGGIAAYKSLTLLRLLQQDGHTVRVLATESGLEFVTAKTIEALSGAPMLHNHQHLWRHDQMSAANPAMPHIDYAKWADLILVAPITANRIAHMAQGYAPDLLGNLLLASTAKIAIAPSMNVEMWQKPAVQTALNTLKSRDVHVLMPESGAQACGDVGPGRMMEPCDIAAYMATHISVATPMGTNTPTFKHMMITAGATREAIDPVRFISNRSSGATALALAEEAVKQGIAVTFIHGHMSARVPPLVAARATMIAAESAEAMHAAVMADAPRHQVLVAIAAVADYKPRAYTAEKMPSGQAALTLELAPNPDILNDSQKATSSSALRVGFSLQRAEQYPDGTVDSTALLAAAHAKMAAKGLDMVIANDTRAMDGDESEWWLLRAKPRSNDSTPEHPERTTEQKAEHWPRAAKTTQTKKLFDAINTAYRQKNHASAD